MSKGKRYDTEPKLNIKKVIAVIAAFLVIIMFVVGIKVLLKDKETVATRTFAVGYYAINDNGKWGVMDTKENIVIQPIYDEMIIVPDNSKPLFIITSDVNYETGTFSSKAYDNNKNLLYADYDKVEALYNQDKSNNLWYENILKVQKEGKYGLINFDGKEVLPCEYDEIKTIAGTKNVVLTIKDEKQGIADNTGNVLVKNEYAQVNTITNKYADGFIIKNDDGKYGIVSASGELVVEAKYDEIKNVTGNKMYVAKDGENWKIVNEEGNSFLENAFEDVKQINLENVVLKKDGKYGVITINGETKIEASYDDLSFIFTDTYIAKKDNKYGIININNEEKLPFEYSFIKYETEADFIRAQKDNLTTELLDRDFNVKVEGIVSEINTDKNYIRVRVNDNYKYYNFKLEEKPVTEFLSNNTLFLSKENGKYGYVDSKGIVVVNYIYDDATEQNKYGYVSVKKDGKWGCLDCNGKAVVEPTYNMENNLVIDFIGTWHLAEDLNANYYIK